MSESFLPLFTVYSSPWAISKQYKATTSHWYGQAQITKSHGIFQIKLNHQKDKENKQRRSLLQKGWWLPNSPCALKKRRRGKKKQATSPPSFNRFLCIYIYFFFLVFYSIYCFSNLAVHVFIFQNFVPCHTASNTHFTETAICYFISIQPNLISGKKGEKKGWWAKGSLSQCHNL